MRWEFLVAATVIIGGALAAMTMTASRRKAEHEAATQAGPPTPLQQSPPSAGQSPAADGRPAQPQPPEQVRAGESAASIPKKKSTIPDPPSVKFSDVAGLEEAVEELREVQEYLANPRRFRALGAEMPRGVLLYGEPGCGKTLLARALAGEAGVPFLSASAASFVERYVGTGAARIRELFEEAKEHAPAIVFIDELDAIGRQRTGESGGDREYDHTLNQLLVELDGFTDNPGVLLLGATNRPELIDSALLRPGRFDRRIRVEQPDRRGREHILRLHAAKRPVSRRVDWSEVATNTTGLSAAQLASVVNEAALLAARRNRDRIGSDDVDEACARVTSGTQTSRLLSADERQLAAVHEAGHALLTMLVVGMRPPARVSIIGRSGSFDRSIWEAGEDREFRTRRELLAQLIVLLGGRAAEVYVFGEPSTRAEDDLEHAASLARQMVERWAMTGRYELAGAGGTKSRELPYTEASAGAHEVRKLVSKAERAAQTILADHEADFRRLSNALLERETLSAAELSELVSKHRQRGTRAISSTAHSA